MVTAWDTMSGTLRLSWKALRAKMHGRPLCWRNKMTNKSNSQNKAGFIKRTWQRTKLIPLGLLMIYVSLVTGCASGSQPVRPLSPQVQVDQALMVTPNFQETLLKYLSVNPDVPMSGLNDSKKP
ncbi:Rz1 lysis protein [Dickeya phage Mysterion]|uniref:Rz1 lysis protein n=1 Tax=Dickeya phage Mysterion TaxID=2320193 RepID=A0A385IG69_9CAUD|nr:Rz-like spanin [Dickeya phage Mysterion]AXY81982.1 Rz1 lysis protein [Dickeya phage Mysterion]